MDETTPLRRTLQTLQAIQDRPGLNARALADRLGVTERAVRRYVETLRAAEVPIDSTRGRHGGYRLGRGSRLAPVVFTEDEAIALVTAVLAVTAARRDPPDLRIAALDKVIRALPQPIREQAAVVRDTATGAGRPDPLPEPAVVTALVDAIADRVAVVLDYAGASGSRHDTAVDPWALVVRHGHWYLLCRSHRADDSRTLRVDRIGSVTRTGTRFRPPVDLDPLRDLERALGSGWALATHVVFDAPLEQVAHWVNPTAGELSQDPSDPDRCVLRGSTSEARAYVVERLAPIPHPWTVIGGPELIEAARQVAEAVAGSVGGSVEFPLAGSGTAGKSEQSGQSGNSGKSGKAAGSERRRGGRADP